MSEANFQARVQPWLMECFGPMIAGDREERNHRFFEESAELVQACGMSASEAHQLVDYVWNRPVGERFQEVGGVMVTLAALCLANELDMHAAAETELARVWTKVEAIRAKQAAKPKHSPLPQATEPARSAERPDPSDIQGWAVTINVNAQDVLTIGHNSLSGIDNIEDFAPVVRNCAEHLLSFIGAAQSGEPATIDKDAVEWQDAFNERHEFDIYPDHFMTGLRNEFSAGWHAARKNAASPAAPSVAQDERGAFNGWASERFPAKHLSTSTDRRAMDEAREFAWEGWQARAASTSANVSPIGVLSATHTAFEFKFKPVADAPVIPYAGMNVYASPAANVAQGAEAVAIPGPTLKKVLDKRALTKEVISAAWRDCGAHSNSPPDWALQFAQNIARALTVAQPAKQRLPISTAPRDGSTIILFFGEDTVTQGRYLPVAHEPRHPWQFIDSQGEGNWFANRSTDDDLGPSHWMPMPGDEA